MGLSREQKKLLEEMKEKVANGECFVVHKLSKDASKSDALKYSLCGEICEVFVDNGLTYKYLAELMKTDLITAKRAVHYHYRSFSVEELDAYAENLSSAKRTGKILSLKKIA